MAVMYTDEEKKRAAQANGQQDNAEQQKKASNGTAAEAKTTTAAPVVDQRYQYDASSNDSYMQALAALQEAQTQKPSYAGTYDAQIDDLYNQIVNRDKFSYNLNEDMIYNQYKDQYVKLGQMAMKDSMGQAAALTGGYGSSYGQSVGQQQYNAYLQQLNDVVPELYGMALDQYNAEGDALYQQYAMLGDRADDEYNKYLGSLDQYWQNLNYLQGQADDAYNRGYENWYNSYQMGVDADDRAYQTELDNYQKQQDSYDKLVELITSSGYKPTADELSAAGMSSSQSKAYLDYYNKNNAGTGGSKPSGNTTPSTGSYNNGGLTYDQVKQLQNALGVTADGKYGPATKNAAGGLSAKDAYKKYVTSGGANVFTGSTYSEAVAYLTSKGVNKGKASGIMDQATWNRHRSAYKSTGRGVDEVQDFNTYKEYLADIVEYLLSTK